MEDRKFRKEEGLGEAEKQESVILSERFESPG
jgi:hypothetical protein